MGKVPATEAEFRADAERVARHNALIAAWAAIDPSHDIATEVTYFADYSAVRQMAVTGASPHGFFRLVCWSTPDNAQVEAA